MKKIQKNVKKISAFLVREPKFSFTGEKNSAGYNWQIDTGGGAIEREKGLRKKREHIIDKKLFGRIEYLN